MATVSELEVKGTALAAPRCRVRRTPLTWVRGGGLTTLLFLPPLLLIFGAFSWYPDRPHGRDVAAAHELVQARPGSGSKTSARFGTTQLPIAVKNTIYFAGLALVFGYPIPLAAAVLMSEVRNRRGVYSALAYCLS
jgi:multiple sugar transport system permease protein